MCLRRDQHMGGFSIDNTEYLFNENLISNRVTVRKMSKTKLQNRLDLGRRSSAARGRTFGPLSVCRPDNPQSDLPVIPPIHMHRRLICSFKFQSLFAGRSLSDRNKIATVATQPTLTTRHTPRWHIVIHSVLTFLYSSPCGMWHPHMLIAVIRACTPSI